jgi:hypothetical protein
MAERPEKLRFLAGVIKSIAGDRKRALRQTVLLDEEREVREARRGLMDYEGTEARAIRAKLDVKRIITLFDDDSIAQKMLMGMADGTRHKRRGPRASKRLERDGVREQAKENSQTHREVSKIRRRIEKLKT